MDVIFLSVEAKKYTNQKTGELGTDYELSVLAPAGVRRLRISAEQYRQWEGIPQQSPVRIGFDFVEGRYGRHYANVSSIERVAVAK